MHLWYNVSFCSPRHNVGRFVLFESFGSFVVFNHMFVSGVRSKTMSSSEALNLSLCTSSSVMEYSTGLCAAWTWWSSSHSHAVYRWSCSITSSHLQLWVTARHVTSSITILTAHPYWEASIWYICAFKMNRAVKNTLHVLLIFYCFMF